MNRTFLTVMLAVFAAGVGLAQPPEPVRTEGGLAQGTSEDGLTVYRGIPFAAPPVGDSNPQVMYFNQTPHTGPVPSAESLKVVDAYFAWRRTPEGEAWAK